MNRDELMAEVLCLPIEDRIDLIIEIVQSVEDGNPRLDLTSEQRKELIRRLEEFKKNPEIGFTWEEFVACARNSA